MITNQQLADGIAPELRAFFIITSADELPDGARPVAESLWRAIKAFARVARIRRSVHIIFSASPFRVPLKSGTLIYETRPDSINVAWDDYIIFLDVDKMLPRRPEIQTACILEELVHAMMNVHDEDLTSVIVAQIYPGVVVRGGQYVVPSGTSA